MAGPHKDYYENAVGEVVQICYEFLEELFDEKSQKKLRDSLFNCADEAALRTALAEHDIRVAAPVRIMLVDIEYARTKVYGDPIKPTEDWYVLVLPPVPRRETKDPTKEDYKEMQAWASAWYHASNDGYGM